MNVACNPGMFALNDTCYLMTTDLSLRLYNEVRLCQRRLCLYLQLSLLDYQSSAVDLHRPLSQLQIPHKANMATGSALAVLNEPEPGPPTTASIKFWLYGRGREQASRTAKLKVFKGYSAAHLTRLGWDLQSLLGEPEKLQLGGSEDLQNHLSQQYPQINKLLVKLVFPIGARGVPDLFEVMPEVQAIFGWLWPLAGRCEFGFSIVPKSNVEDWPEWMEQAILGTVMMQFIQHGDPEMPIGEVKEDSECTWGLGEELNVVRWEPIGVAL
jgi:hypothetical protein